MPGHTSFDRLAPFYDFVMRPADLTHLRQLAGLPSVGRLLDAGGGTGRIAAGLVGLADRVVVADESLPMLRRARAKAIPSLVASRTEELPFPDESFARVVMVDAFHHLADQQASLAELWRILRPGGRLVIQEPDITRAAVRLVVWMERLARMRSRFVAPERIAAMAAGLGAQSRVDRVGLTAWIAVEKRAA